MIYVDFKKKQKSRDFSLIFPRWKSGETVAFLSPHDDDVLLGAGCLLKAVVENKGVPLILIMCQGDAGYSQKEKKDTITEVRKKEAFSAYGRLGVSSSQIHFLGVPDFSLMTHVNRKIFQNSGLFEEQIRIFRQEKVSRVVFSSGHLEHWDHTAVYFMGIYTSPNAGDPVLTDLGKPHAVKSYLVYSVWGDFAPSSEGNKELRASKGILVNEPEEDKIRKSVKEFSSQEKIFSGVVKHRKKRKGDPGFLELYQDVYIRKPTRFRPYFEAMKKMSD